MDTIDILKDSLKYSVSDIRQLIILSLPAIVIMLFSVLTINYLTVDTLMVISPIYLILIVFLVLFYSGLMLNVIKETVNLNHRLPDINLKVFLLDGLKYIIVECIMVGIVSFIVIFLSEYAKLHVELAVILLVFMFIFAIIEMYLSVLNVVSSGKLAQTNSIADALSFTHLKEIADKIGKIKIYVTLLLAGIVTSLILSLLSFLTVIPVIGIIIYAVLITLMLIFNARVTALLYNERNLKENNVQVNQDMDKIEQIPKIQYAPTAPESQDSFEEYIEKTEQEDLKSNNLVQCSKCGHLNPGFVDLCLNCGEKL